MEYKGLSFTSIYHSFKKNPVAKEHQKNTSLIAEYELCKRQICFLKNQIEELQQQTLQFDDVDFQYGSLLEHKEKLIKIEAKSGTIKKWEQILQQKNRN